MTQQGGGRAASAPSGTNWKMITKRLVAFGTRYHRLSPDDAEEVAQEAMSRFFDPAYVAYDPDRYGTVLWFLGSVYNGICVNRRRRRATVKDWFVMTAALGEMEPSPEEIMLAAEHVKTAVELLIERTIADPFVQKILMLRLEGIEHADEQAASLGIPIGEVYEARERLNDDIAAVGRLLGGQ